MKNNIGNYFVKYKVYGGVKLVSTKTEFISICKKKIKTAFDIKITIIKVIQDIHPKFAKKEIEIEITDISKL